MRKLATGHYKFKVKINSKVGYFILDTGASTSCLGIERIEGFSLQIEESEVKAAGAGAINMETKIARNNRVQMGSKVLTKVDFILFDLEHVNAALAQVNEMPVSGIIGADILKYCKAKIDYGRNCLYLK